MSWTAGRATMTRSAVTHIVEVENPSTGMSRMFSGTDMDDVLDQATAWLDEESGSFEEQEPIVWGA